MVGCQHRSILQSSPLSSCFQDNANQPCSLYCKDYASTTSYLRFCSLSYALLWGHLPGFSHPIDGGLWTGYFLDTWSPICLRANPFHRNFYIMWYAGSCFLNIRFNLAFKVTLLVIRSSLQSRCVFFGTQNSNQLNCFLSK